MRAPSESSLSCTFCRAGRLGPCSVALDNPFLLWPQFLVGEGQSSPKTWALWLLKP